MSKFSIQLKEAIKEKGFTNTELAKRIGKTSALIGLYVNDKLVPGDEVLKAINNVLGTNLVAKRPKPKPRVRNSNPNRISVQEAAKLLGVTALTLQLTIREGILPFAFAVKTSSQYTYHISRQGLENYINGKYVLNYLNGQYIFVDKEKAPEGAATPNESNQ